jgi:hypothetical protein
MRTLLLAGLLAVAGFAITTPISIAPASAQVAVDTPLGGVRVGPQPRYYRDYGRATIGRRHRPRTCIGTNSCSLSSSFAPRFAPNRSGETRGRRPIPHAPWLADGSLFTAAHSDPSTASPDRFAGLCL